MHCKNTYVRLTYYIQFVNAYIHNFYFIPNAFNAGVDLNDFTPQTLSQLIARNNT